MTTTAVAVSARAGRHVAETVQVYKGSVVESGPVDAVLDQPKHEPTARLVASVAQMIG